MSHSQNSERLRREISRMGVAALAINGLIGAGIFALPAGAAARAGAFSPAMFVICGVLMSAVVLSFGQAASYFRGTGGPILYAQTAFGSLIGFQTGWLLYLGRVSAMAANTNAMVSYAGVLWGGINTGAGRMIAIFLVCLFFTLVNVIGVQRGMRTTNILTVLKLLPLLLFVALGLAYVRPDVFANAAPPAFDSFAGTLLLLVYAFVGFEGAVVPAGESKNPRRDIPRALLATLLAATLLYALIQMVCVAVLPGLADTQTPLADAARALVGPAGAWIMTLAAFLSIAGNLSAIMVAAPRMTYALARDNSLPGWFGVVHEQHQTPDRSIVFLGALSFALAVSGSFVWLAVMSSLTRMLGYGVCIAALPRLKKRFGHSEHVFHLPGGFLIPAVALALCVWLAAQATLLAWMVTAAFVIAGSLLFLFARRTAARKAV